MGLICLKVQLAAPKEEGKSGAILLTMRKGGVVPGLQRVVGTHVQVEHETQQEAGRLATVVQAALVEAGRRAAVEPDP